MSERIGPWSTVYQRFRDWHIYDALDQNQSPIRRGKEG
ncbi:transposase [Pseudomonas sp. CFSAN084952]|nr:transposase [Pseudomonas sp. CFSAN084952]